MELVEANKTHSINENTSESVKKRVKTLMKRHSEAMMPLQWGQFNMIAYANEVNEPMPHIALVSENMDPTKPVLVRMHSECLTGDLLGSKRCDCGEQLDGAMTMAAEQGGVIIYLRQEGRGIGIINKLKAYQLQDTGLNTIDANTHLGLEVDSREYSMAIAILEDLGITSIDLMTNNPMKIKAIEESSININQRVPLIIPSKKENVGYLKTKKDLMGHLLG